VSRAAVRTAAATWLEAAEIFDRVDAAKVLYQAPTFTAGSAKDRCNAYILLGPDHEGRIADGGPYSGMKLIDYVARVVMHFWSIDSDWVAAQLRFDERVEACKAQVRSGGRTLGRPDVVLQAGEWTFGIDADVDEPVALNGGTLFSTGDVSFQISEVIFS
jgi:hypothetical protein